LLRRGFSSRCLRASRQIRRACAGGASQCSRVRTGARSHDVLAALSSPTPYAHKQDSSCCHPWRKSAFWGHAGELANPRKPWVKRTAALDMELRDSSCRSGDSGISACSVQISADTRENAPQAVARLHEGLEIGQAGAQSGSQSINQSDSQSDTHHPTIIQAHKRLPPSISPGQQTSAPTSKGMEWERARARASVKTPLH
jgi:hypothetical protein